MKQKFSVRRLAAPGLLVFAGLLAFQAPPAGASVYPFQVSRVQTADKTMFIAENDGPAPVSIQISLTRAVNVSSAQPWPVTAVIPGNSRRAFASVTPSNPAQASTFSYLWKYQMGDLRAVPDTRFAYYLPFAPGHAYLVSQAYGGFLPTHNAPSAYYAVDFVMPRGTPVLAARAGKVIEVVQNNGEGGRDPSFLDKANYVRVLHADGTMAEYVHLTAGTARVKVGQQVVAGQELGLSGNSGYTSGPHLHFNIQRNKDNTIVSVPFFFAGKNSGQIYPREGEFVSAG